jgi:hypothetical protein
MIRRTAACLAIATAAALTATPADAADSPGANTSCTVFVVGSGTSSCTYLAVGTSGTLTAFATGGNAVASVRCTFGGAGVTANGAVVFARTGFCLLTLTFTAGEGSGAAVASAN